MSRLSFVSAGVVLLFLTGLAWPCIHVPADYKGSLVEDVVGTAGRAGPLVSDYVTRDGKLKHKLELRSAGTGIVPSWESWIIEPAGAWTYSKEHANKRQLVRGKLTRNQSASLIAHLAGQDLLGLPEQFGDVGYVPGLTMSFGKKTTTLFLTSAGPPENSARIAEWSRFSALVLVIQHLTTDGRTVTFLPQTETAPLLQERVKDKEGNLQRVVSFEVVTQKTKTSPARLKGMKAAVADLEAGKLAWKKAPLPDPPWYAEYWRLLKTECGVERILVKDFFRQEVRDEMWAYNGVMQLEIEHRFGKGILKKLADKAQEKSGRPAHKPVVRELKGLQGVKATKDTMPAGGFGNPVAFSSMDELAMRFKIEDPKRLQEQVDFAKEKILWFAWVGSSRDKLLFEVHKGKEGYFVDFKRLESPTEERPIQNSRFFVIAKEAKWSVMSVGPARIPGGNLPPGRLPLDAKGQTTLNDHNGAVVSLAFSPDGKFLAVGRAGHDRKKKEQFREVKLWDVATAKELATFGRYSQGDVVPKAFTSVYGSAIAFSADSKTLAVAGDLAGNSGNVTLWDVAARKVKFVLRFSEERPIFPGGVVEAFPLELSLTTPYLDNGVKLGLGEISKVGRRITVKANLDGKGKGKGSLIIDPNSEGRNAFGDLTGSVTEIAPLTVEVTLKQVKVPDPAKKGRRLYEITGSHVFVVISPTGTGPHRLIVKDKVGNILHVLPLQPVPVPPGDAELAVQETMPLALPGPKK